MTLSDTWLVGQRLEYKLTDDWKLAAEYRRLTQEQARDYKQGLILEVTRNIYDMAEVSIGYNMTRFTDDLTRLDYVSEGPYVRMTGKFYDRSPEEMEALRAEIEADRMDRLTRRLMSEQAASKSPISLDYSAAYTLVEQWRTTEKKFQQMDAMAREYFTRQDMEHAKPLWVSIADEAQAQLKADILLSDYRSRFRSWMSRSDGILVRVNKILLLQMVEREKQRSQAEIKDVIARAGELYKQGNFKEARRLLLDAEPRATRPAMRKYISANPARVAKAKARSKKEAAAWVNVQRDQEADGNAMAKAKEAQEIRDTKRDISYLYREVNFYIREAQFNEARASALKVLEIDPSETKAREYIDRIIPEAERKTKGLPAEKPQDTNKTGEPAGPLFLGDSPSLPSDPSQDPMPGQINR